jgi:REP element-mobilizing transposase RayT
MKINDRVRSRSSVPHSARPEVRGVCHVVLRVRRGLPWLRTPRTYRVLERALRAGKERRGFALVQFSVQGDHLHLLVEADGKQALARGMQGLAIRMAKSLNRFWRRRGGSVFAERYFARAVQTAREIKRALAYVLNNARKHGVWTSPSAPDPFSSGRWYSGWFEDVRNFCRPLRAPPVVPARDLYLSMPSFRCLSLSFVPGRRLDTSEALEALLSS